MDRTAINPKAISDKSGMDAEEDLIVIGARRAGRCAGLDALRENSSVEAQMPKCDSGPTKASATP